jgi:hypothetical protein
MNPLLAVVLFWAFLFVAMSLFGIVCIKYGVSSRERNYKPVLDV